MAVHLQRTLHLSRTQPELPADEIFTRDEIDAAQILGVAHHLAKVPPLGTPLTLATAVELIARLGGYSARRGEGPPGPTAFARGYELVAAVVLAFQTQREIRNKPPSTHSSGQ